MLLVLDNRDSFVFNIVQALRRQGARVEVRRSSAVTVEEVRELAPERVLIGPGPGRPEGAGASLDVIRALGERVPVLGVCLGHQAIASAFGGSIVRARELVHGRAVRVRHEGRGVLRGLPSPLACTRYNSLTVREETLPACLEVTARSEDGEVMALRHRELPLEGVQFHPEAVRSEGGDLLFANFLAALPSVRAAGP